MGYQFGSLVPCQSVNSFLLHVFEQVICVHVCLCTVCVSDALRDHRECWTFHTADMRWLLICNCSSFGKLQTIFLIQESPEKQNPSAHHSVSFCKCSHLTHLFRSTFFSAIMSLFHMTKVVQPSPRHLDNGEITHNSPQPLFRFWRIFFPLTKMISTAL